jgi:hypothetical protein
VRGFPAVGALLVAAIASACGRSPTSPTSQLAPEHRLILSGPATILIPGESVQLTATKTDAKLNRRA